MTRAVSCLQCLVGAWLLLVGSHAIFAPFDRDQPPAYCTVYTHLVKSGGTTLKDQLQRQSVKGGMPKPGLCTSDGRTTADMCLAALHNSTIIMGYGEELRNELVEEGRKCEFFTMMRNPIDRALSAFFYCPKDHDVQTRRPEKWCGDAQDQEMPISDRFVEFVTHMFRNTAYQSLSRSIVCRPGFELCKQDQSRMAYLESPESWEILRKVEEILLSYNAVGIFEKWALSMQLFDARVRSPVEKWDANLASNPGMQSPAREELTRWAHDSPEIHSLLSADIHIYRFSTAIFKKQAAMSLGVVWA